MQKICVDSISKYTTFILYNRAKSQFFNFKIKLRANLCICFNHSRNYIFCLANQGFRRDFIEKNRGEIHTLFFLTYDMFHQK